MQFITKFTRRLMIIGIWFFRILPAKNHFGLNPFIRLKYAILGGFMVDQYALYNLKDKKNRKLYLSEYDWYKSRYINDPFDRMLDNKIICTEVLHHYIKVPEIYFLKNNGKMTLFPAIDAESLENQNRWATSQDAVDLLEEHGPLFIKPLAAGKGNGVRRIEKLVNTDNNDAAYMIDDEMVSEAALLEYLDKENDYFICQGVSQCDYLNELYDKTTNTIRLITLRDPKTGKFKVFFAVQRIGTKETIPVDNGSRGGLVAKIDLETGELSEAQSLHSLTRHKVHPDSKNPIEGVVVPNWNAIKEQMVELASRFPYLNFVAWDLLVDENNDVYVIEANKSSGVNIIQLWGPQKQGELGDFYRFHGAIK